MVCSQGEGEQNKSGGRPLYLVSACLVGLNTRYDGRIEQDADCLKALSGAVWIPFCPERLGGLPTPRDAADIIHGDGRDVLAGKGKVITKSGTEVTENFIAGAQQALNLAQSQPIAEIFLKKRSPSCGVTPVVGVTAALLIEHGFCVREF